MSYASQAQLLAIVEELAALDMADHDVGFDGGCEFACLFCCSSELDGKRALLQLSDAFAAGLYGGRRYRFIPHRLDCLWYRACLLVTDPKSSERVECGLCGRLHVLNLLCDGKADVCPHPFCHRLPGHKGAHQAKSGSIFA